MIPRLKNLNERQTVILLAGIALAYRAAHFVVFANMIVPEQDATRNIELGRHFASGNFYGVLDDYWPPLYPILLGVATWFVNDLVIPAIIVSCIAGALAVPLIYYFVKQSYDSRAATVAAIIAIFYPYLITSVFGLGSENVYLDLIVAVLIVGWNGLARSSAIDYFWAGILLGLAYLTRPEAIGYLIFFVGLTVVKAIWQKRILERKALLQVAALLLGFSLLSVPYIVYLRGETGSWTISGKTSQNLAAGFFDEDASRSQSQPEQGQPAAKATLKDFAENLVYGVRLVQRYIGNLLPMFLLVIAGMGLFGERWSDKRFKREMYLLAFCFLTVAGYVATWVIERYLYVLLPIFIGWTAIGILRLEHWFRESSRSWLFGDYISRIGYKTFVTGCLTFVFLYVFTTNFYVRSTNSEWQGRAYEERDAGIWLRENGKTHPLIFSASFRPIFYADGKRYWTNTRDIQQILSQIRGAGVDYVVDSERARRELPYLKDLARLLQNEPGYELVYRRTDKPGHEISIYALR